MKSFEIKRIKAINKSPVNSAYFFMNKILNRILRKDILSCEYKEKLNNYAVKTTMFLYTLVCPRGLMSLIMCC